MTTIFTFLRENSFKVRKQLKNKKESAPKILVFLFVVAKNENLLNIITFFKKNLPKRNENFFFLALFLSRTLQSSHVDVGEAWTRLKMMMNKRGFTSPNIHPIVDEQIRAPDGPNSDWMTRKWCRKNAAAASSSPPLVFFYCFCCFSLSSVWRPETGEREKKK